MAVCDDRQLTQAQREEGFTQNRTGAVQAIRPFTGAPTAENLADYINRELFPVVKATRKAANDIYLQVADNAPSANPLAYYFSVITAGGDPTTGRTTLNASPQNTATVLRISQTNGRLVDVLPWLDVMNGSVTEPLGVVTLADAINPGRFLRADLDTMTDQGAYWDLGIVITEASHPDPFVDAEAVTLAFIPGVADNGGLGAQIPPGSITPMSANTLLGNPTAAPAAPVEIPVAALSLVGRSAGNIEALDAPATVDGQALYMRTNAGGTLIDWFTMSEASMPRISDGFFFANMSGVSPGQVLAKSLANMAGPGLRFNTASVGDYKFVAQGSTSIIVGVDGGDDDIQRAALTGDVTAAQNVNTTAFRSFSALSVLARAANSAGIPTELSAVAASGAVLRESGSAISFGTVATAGIADGAVTLAKQANLAAGTAIGRQIDGGTGVPVALTGLEQGENLRLDTRVDDASTSGTGNPYTVAAETNWVRFTALTGAYTLTGCDASTAGKLIVWHVEPGTTGTLVFAHSGAAITTQRFFCPGGVNLTIGPGDTVITCFTSNRHRVIAVTRQGFALTDADKGDITVSASGTVWTIDNSAVTLAKLANQADDTFLANISGGSAPPSAVALTTLAGAGLTGGADAVLAVGAGTGITVNANDVAWNGTTTFVPDGDKGDITVSASGATWTVDTNIVKTWTGNHTFDGASFAVNATSDALIHANSGIGLFAGSTLAVADVSVNDIAINAVGGLKIEVGSATASVNPVTGQVDIDATTGILLDTAGGVITMQGIADMWMSTTAGGIELNTLNAAHPTGVTNGQINLNAQAAINATALVDSTLTAPRWLTTSNVGSLTFTSAATATFNTTTSFTVNATTNVNLNATGDALIAATSGVGLFAGHTVAGIATGDVLVNATGGIGLVSDPTTPVTDITTGFIEVRAASNFRVACAGVENLEIVGTTGAWQVGGATGTSGHPLVSAGSAAPPAWGQLPTAGIADAAVTLAKQANLAQSTIIGRAEGAGTGVPQALTPTQVIAIVDGESPTWTSSHRFDSFIQFGTSTGLPGSGDIRKAATLALNSGDDITLTATDDIALSATDDINITASGDTTVSGSASLTLSSAAAVAVSAGSDVTIGAPGDVTVTAGDDVILSPTGSISLNSSDVLVGSGTGMISLQSGVRRTNIVPNTTNGTINDLAIGNAAVVRFTQADILTGMVPSEDGQEVILMNAGTTGDDLRVDFESISSTAANRFSGFGTSRKIMARDFGIAIYDGTSDRWRLLVYPQ